MFVVYLTEYSGTLLPQFYIGSTTLNKAMSGKYFGSVKSEKWKKIFVSETKNHPELFSLEILSEHSTRVEALQREYDVQKERDVVNSPCYFNEAFASPRGFFGRGSVTESQRKAASDRMKRMNSKEISGRKPGNFKSGIKQNNAGEKNPMFGKTQSEKSRGKNSESVKRARETKIVCEHCSREVDSANFKRWHGEKCKHK